MSTKLIAPGEAHFLIKFISRKHKGHELSHQTVIRGSAGVLDVVELWLLLLIDDDNNREDQFMFDNKKTLFIERREHENE